jgi:hypothetical protein
MAESPAAKPHRAAPHKWQFVKNYGLMGTVYSRERGCQFCGRPIQRRGLLRRWAHVE